MIQESQTVLQRDTETKATTQLKYLYTCYNADA